MLELFQYGFMQRALAVGIIVALLAAYYGVFVVQRGLAFMGSGLAHAAFAGVALGVLLEHEPLLYSVPYTVLASLGIVWLQRRTGLAADTAIGVLFALSMALGILLLSFTDRFTADAASYLFGSILAVTPFDIAAAGAMAVLTAALFPFWGRWAYATLDRELAEADGLAVEAHDYLLAALLAASIVVSIKAVGVILVSAMFVIPAASARLVSRRFSSMTLMAVVFSVGSVVVGLVASTLPGVRNAPAASCIVLAQAAAFIAAWGLALARRRAARRRAEPDTP